jgi:hypothetical protein
MPEEVVVKEQENQQESAPVKNRGYLGAMLDSYTKKPDAEPEVKDEEPKDEEKSDDKSNVKKEEPEAKEPTVDELKTEKQNLLNEIEKLKKNAPEGMDDDFISDLKENVLDAFDKHGEKYGLPDVESVMSEVQKRATVQAEITNWQQDELVKEIEKKHDIEEGTFVFDPSEAWSKGTPSCEFREKTEKKEREINTRQERYQKEREKQLSLVAEQQGKDKDYIKETFYGEDEETFNAKMEEFNSLGEKMAEGDIGKNPFAVRNIFRGVYFDELAQTMVDKAVAKVHKQYEAQGMTLPDRGSGPDGASTVNGSEVISENDTKSKKKHGFQNVMFNKYKNQ